MSFRSLLGKVTGLNSSCITPEKKEYLGNLVIDACAGQDWEAQIEFTQETSERPDVYFPSERLNAKDDLRRAIETRLKVGEGLERLGAAGAKVYEQGLLRSLRAKHDILRLDVAVVDAQRVDFGEGEQQILCPHLNPLHLQPRVV